MLSPWWSQASVICHKLKEEQHLEGSDARLPPVTCVRLKHLFLAIECPNVKATPVAKKVGRQVENPRQKSKSNTRRNLETTNQQMDIYPCNVSDSPCSTCTRLKLDTTCHLGQAAIFIMPRKKCGNPCLTCTRLLWDCLGEQRIGTALCDNPHAITCTRLSH